MWDLILNNFLLFLFIFARMAGLFLFNPILGNKNVPVIVKMGLSLFLAAITLPLLSNINTEDYSTIAFIGIAVKELFVGFTMGFIMRVFLSMIYTAGEIIDVQLGIGMSKVYDPQSNVSLALTGSIYNIMYMLIFFSTNSHFTLMQIVVRSCELFPPGTMSINFEVGEYIILLFGEILMLALKIAIPIIAIELLTEAGIGVIMKTIPQINIFVLSLPLKLFIGITIFVVLLPSVARVINVSSDMMYGSIERILTSMLS